MIEHWIMCQRLDWAPGPINPWILPPEAPVPVADEMLEIFQVVRASDYEVAVSALAELVRLKDGPRDDAYRAAKDAAWDAARAALSSPRKKATE